MQSIKNKYEDKYGYKYYLYCCRLTRFVLQIKVFIVFYYVLQSYEDSQKSANKLRDKMNCITSNIVVLVITICFICIGNMYWTETSSSSYRKSVIDNKKYDLLPKELDLE